MTGATVRKLRVRCFGAVPNASRAREERGDVGAPEAVDRLLGVADDEEAPGLDGDLVPRPRRGIGVGRREERGEIALDGVGVLELVEQEVRVALAQVAAHLPAVLGIAQHLACEHEEVVELEPTRALALAGLVERELRDRPRRAGARSAR